MLLFRTTHAAVAISLVSALPLGLEVLKREDYWPSIYYPDASSSFAAGSNITVSW